MADNTNPIAKQMLVKRRLEKKKQDEETFPNNPKLQAELDSLDAEDKARRNALYRYMMNDDKDKK